MLVLIGFDQVVDAGQVVPSRPADRDLHSLGNPEQIRVSRVELDLSVDFAKKELQGTATLAFRRMPGCPSGIPLDLDTRELKIERVAAGVTDEALTEVRFELGHEGADPVRPESDLKRERLLGTRLRIFVPDDATRVRVTYRTAPTASALQWLDPPRTAGRKQPFLFTQSEAIHARSWIPLQDSPGVRITYAATIRVPEGLRAVMSADQLPGREGQSDARFEMTQPIPPYLIALAVGDLAFRSLSPRTGTYAEPSVVAAAASEFVDTEAMIKAVETRFGPYRWGRYDLLVLPPSFPFGGMENPKLTFATPTILAGDRSLVSLVAHELAHSWSGNLVTNATWRDFWLNEGFTVYLERRIVEDVFGPDRAAMEAVLGLRELREELAAFPPRDQVLHIDLADRDPDEGMTRIPYEKGALFLTTIEHAFGRERFDAFLRAYFDHFAFQSITTADFERYLQAQLLDSDPAAAAKLNVQAWLHEPGLPPGFPEPTSTRFAVVTTAARDWLEGKIPAEQLATRDWSTHEWLHFLQALPLELPPEKMAALDKEFALTGTGNSEITQQWLLMAIRNHYAPADARLESFLTSIGRRKFLMPLYGELKKTAEGTTRAKAIYAKARPFYHPIAVESVDRLLGTK
ncbi:Aminopeptidase N [Singulisphaera sp. GP187]|uniref:M1 family metallopeptidase n=1 Tax=Singulisphaera sp. GP187 TaxID=1882752 RepID=UPI000929CA49|nr:M1 family metallopeptidase [Singulisphaera sp. GP187]SIN96817.1 Aminopeptidase N [Singulisphaera sp. GP187]